MRNDEYRKSRGTDKPFNVSEEQAKATWNEFIRKEKYRHRRPDSTRKATPKG